MIVGIRRAGIDDDVEIVVGAVFFLDEGAKNVFEYAHHRWAVYVFAGFKVGEYIY